MLSIILIYVVPLLRKYLLPHIYKHVPFCNFSLYLKKAGLASRNIVHLNFNSTLYRSLLQSLRERMNTPLPISMMKNGAFVVRADYSFQFRGMGGFISILFYCPICSLTTFLAVCPYRHGAGPEVWPQTCPPGKHRAKGFSLKQCINSNL